MNNKTIPTQEEIESKTQERCKIVREMLGEDFPMLDWYMGRYEDYYRKSQMIEALSQAAERTVYVIHLTAAATVALAAPVDANIQEETQHYPPLFEKDDIYGFILYLVNECGFEMMNTAYTFNSAAYIQAASHTRKMLNAAAIATGGQQIPNEDEQMKVMMDSLNDEQVKRFVNMMKATELLDESKIEETLTEADRQMLKDHNNQVTISIEALKQMVENNRQIQVVNSQAGNKQAPQYTHDGLEMNKETEFVVLLSGYPSNEMMHRYVGIGTREKMQSLSNDIKAALDAGLIDIPYCGTAPEAMRKGKAPLEKDKRGGIVLWGFGPELYSFRTIQDARKFASQFDHHYSETGYILQ